MESILNFKLEVEDPKIEDRLAKLEDLTKKENTKDDLEHRVTKLEVEDPELEDRVAKLEDLAKIGTLRSCYEYSQYGLKTSGAYMIDPDGGLIGQEPFQVLDSEQCKIISKVKINFRCTVTSKLVPQRLCMTLRI